MQSSLKKLILLIALIGALINALTDQVTAQTFTILHAFTTLTHPNLTNNNGAFSEAGLILSTNTLYGTTSGGGNSGNGTVFRINTDGTSFTNLYNFSTIIEGTNSDGASPRAGLILSSNILYGTTHGGGGLYGRGTIFAINTDGTDFTNLHNFSYTSDGASPQGGLILSGDTLYGTAWEGGSSGYGTVFAVKTDGSDFTNLHNFSSLTLNSQGVYTNNDGAYPMAGLMLSGNTLYGTASKGGSFGFGTLFAVSTNGTYFTNLYTFSNTGDGSEPFGGLILLNGMLYGTTFGGGTAGGGGTVFAINTNGTSYTNLYSFTGIDIESQTNSDGALPEDGLILSGSTLYGTTSEGGASGWGTIFAVTTSGMGFTNLYNFTSDGGWSPLDGLILSGCSLFGTTSGGGTSQPPTPGTVFSISFKPQLTITPSGTNVILAWPTNVAGFDYDGFNLECSTNLAPPTVWSTVSPVPVTLNGQNVVTNPISGTQMFYQLSQ